MRIIAGRLKGKKLITPEGLGTRPTPNRLRVVLFQILENHWGRPLECPDVLDLYAGCGSLGGEAASRGVNNVLFVENNPAALSALRANLRAFRECLGDSVRLMEKADFVENAMVRLKEEGRRFTLILADPPYQGGEVAGLLEKAEDRLAEGGILALQHHRSEAAPEKVGRLRCWDQREQGLHRLSFYSIGE